MKIGWCAALLSCCTVVGGEAGLGEAGLLSSSSSSSLSSPSFSPTGAPPPIPDHSRKEPMRSQVLTYLSALDACCDVGNPRCKFEAATLYLLPEARSEALQSLYTSASKNFVHLPRSPNDASTLLSDAMEGGSAQALVLGALALSAGLATVKTSGDVDPTVWPASSCQDENTEIDLRRNFTTSWISEKMLYYVVENGHALFDTDDGSGHNAAIMAYASLASSRAVGAARMAAGEAKSRKRRTRDTNGSGV